MGISEAVIGMRLAEMMKGVALLSAYIQGGADGIVAEAYGKTVKQAVTGFFIEVYDDKARAEALWRDLEAGNDMDVEDMLDKIMECTAKAHV